MTRLQRWLTGLGIGATVWAAGVTVGYAVAASLAAQRVEASTVAAASLRDSLVVARAAVRVDSVRVDSVVTRWRIAKARIDTMTDTVRLVDTLKVLVSDAEDALNICTLAFDGCNNALALAERRAAADSVRVLDTRALLTIETARASRAESLTWRHRVEGAALAAAAALAVSQLRKE